MNAVLAAVAPRMPSELEAAIMTKTECAKKKVGAKNDRAAGGRVPADKKLLLHKNLPLSEKVASAGFGPVAQDGGRTGCALS